MRDSHLTYLPSSSNTATDFYESNNVIDGTKYFPGVNSTSRNEIKENVEESTIEAKDFDIQAKIPVYIKKGERVKISFKRESLFTQTTSTSNSFRTEQIKSTLYVEQEQIIKELTERNRVLNQYVEELELKISPSHDTIKENAKEVEGMTETSKNADFSFKAIKMVTNTAITISGIFAFVFFICFAFNVYMNKADSMFGFSLTFMTALMFTLDKIYRRSINHGS
ncbi:hypothetical protein [Priestia megaterium]|uniref:hypothetical protein n=1 Tax=Priestia megaterium TaxID=1404 RepID=UPI0009907A83|nr:hypothetical protein [Priestia megaterium]AQU73806.1 hypothetical protein BUW91_11050 [Priestia megaterium]